MGWYVASVGGAGENGPAGCCSGEIIVFGVGVKPPGNGTGGEPASPVMVCGMR